MGCKRLPTPETTELNPLVRLKIAQMFTYS